MKKFKKLILTIAAAATLVLCVFALAACSTRLDVETIKNNGYIHTVTIDMCGGKANEEAMRTIMVKDGSFVPEPGADGAVAYKAPTREGYIIEEYCRGTKSEDGTVTYGEPWDFNKDRVTGDVTIYVKWRKNFNLQLHYGKDYAETKVQEVAQNDDGSLKPVTNFTSISISAYTVLEFYSDEAKQNKLEFPFTPTCTDENPDMHIWVNTLIGKWVIVKTADDFASLRSASTGIYLTCDIDMTGKTFTPLDGFSAKFHGNGHTIENLTVDYTQPRATRASNIGGLFGQITGSAEIKDVTFKNFNCKISYSNVTMQHFNVGLIAGSADSRVTISNVTVTGSLTVSTSAELLEKTEYNAFIADNKATLTSCAYDGVTVSTEVK